MFKDPFFSEATICGIAAAGLGTAAAGGLLLWLMIRFDTLSRECVPVRSGSALTSRVLGLAHLLGPASATLLAAGYCALSKCMSETAGSGNWHGSEFIKDGCGKSSAGQQADP